MSKKSKIISEPSGFQGNETIKTVHIDEIDVDIVGCWDKDTPNTEYEFYDLYAGGVCINLGEPMYRLPTKKDIVAFLELNDILQKD